MTEKDYLGGLLKHVVRSQGDKDYFARSVVLYDGEVAGFQVGDRIRYSDVTEKI